MYFMANDYRLNDYLYHFFSINISFTPHKPIVYTIQTNGLYDTNQWFIHKKPMVSISKTIGFSICSLLGTKDTNVSKINQKSIL